MSMPGLAALIAAGVLLLASGACVARPGAMVTPPPATPTAEPTQAAATWSARPIPDGYRIRIPRLGIDLPILEGDIARDIDERSTPDGYAFHLPGTAIPGDGGNVFLYAHARAGMFLALWDARVGDEVLIHTPEGRTLRYVLTEVHPRVPPDDVSVAQPTPFERLTLQTSTGARDSDPRFVVIAMPR